MSQPTEAAKQIQAPQQAPSKLPESKFKRDNPLQKRQKIVSQAKKKYPKSFVVVIEKKSHNKTLPELRHSRFIIQNNTKVIELLQAIKDRLSAIEPKYEISVNSLYFFMGKILANKDELVVKYYDQYHDKQDGILYIQYTDALPF